MRSKYPKFAQDLRIWRKEAGLTQQQLATRAGVSYSAISKYESGDRTPRRDQLEKLLSVLGIDINEVVDDVGDGLFDLTENDLTYMFQECVGILENLSPKYAKRVYEYLLDVKRLDQMDKEE